MSIKPCDQDVFDNGQSVCLVVIPKETAEEICQSLSAATGCKIDWHYFGGRVHIKALAAPVVERHEPFGYWRVPKGFPLQGMFFPWDANSADHMASESAREVFDFHMLYTSPPAPVAVPVEIHQQLIEMRQQFERANFVSLGKLLTACLDKVKELNQ